MSLSKVGRWSRHRGTLVAATLVAGMAVGALVYYASRLTGVSLYVLTGGVTAVLGAALWQWFTRSTAISEIEVTVPQFSKIKFAVTKDHKVLARRIVNQMTSRVTVQSLADDTGRADEAIASVFTFFKFVRELLDADITTSSTPGRAKINVLALNMLNLHLRPFLSTWHRNHGDWRVNYPDAPESEWPDDARFRAALRALQSVLRPIAVDFARMAEYEDYLEIIGLSAEEPPISPPPPVVFKVD